MTTDHENPIARVIRRAARLESVDRPDRELLARYAAERDTAAFEALLHRHGNLVWRLCRASLGESAAAEDAFQATFLVLVRKAGSLRQPDLLVPWLHGVVHRIALRSRKTLARSPRPMEGDVMAVARPDTRVDDRDAERVLHEELRRLPAKYASALVLCCLEGRTTEEAAEQLQWPAGTVKVYLMRGRELLKERLARRGMTAAVAGSLLAPATTSAVPIHLVEATLRSAATFASGGAVGPATQHLVREELLAMTGKRLLVNFTLGLLAAGTAGLGYVAFAQDQESPKPTPKAVIVKTDLETLYGTWAITTCEVDGNKLPDTVAQAARIVIKGNAFRTVAMGADYEGTIKLDPDASPKTIDLTFTTGPEKGNTAKCIYKVDGDSWTLCMSPPAKDRPTKFASVAGSGLVLETFKRAAADDPVPATPAAKAPPPDEKAAAELKRFAGEWEMISGEMSGQPMPEAMAKTMRRVVKGDETSVTMSGQVYFKATMTLNPTKAPRTMDYAMTEGPTRGKTQLGIYEWEDGTLRFCFASPGQPRPTDFTTKANDGRTLSVWKRVQK